MTEEKNKWIEAISKLIKLTQEGKLEWRAPLEMEFPESKTDTDIENIYSIFITTYKNKSLRIYKRKFLVRGFGLTSKKLRDLYAFSKSLDSPNEAEWHAKVILEMIDINGKALWTFPDEKILNDLLIAVEYQVSGVKEFLTAILSEE